MNAGVVAFEPSLIWSVLTNLWVVSEPLARSRISAISDLQISLAQLRSLKPASENTRTANIRLDLWYFGSSIVAYATELSKYGEQTGKNGKPDTLRITILNVLLTLDR
jgi:hypothetical protein